MPTVRQEMMKYITQSQLSSLFEDRMGIHNVKSYGAEGDGITDDSTSINAAVAAVVNSSGNILYYPPGTYKVTSSSLSTNFDNIVHIGDGASFTGSTATIRQVKQTFEFIDLEPIIWAGV